MELAWGLDAHQGPRRVTGARHRRRRLRGLGFPPGRVRLHSARRLITVPTPSPAGECETRFRPRVRADRSCPKNGKPARVKHLRGERLSRKAEEVSAHRCPSPGANVQAADLRPACAWDGPQASWGEASSGRHEENHRRSRGPELRDICRKGSEIICRDRGLTPWGDQRVPDPCQHWRRSPTGES